MDPEATLAEMGLALPAAPAAMANYRPATRAGNLLFLAGQGPIRDGKVTHQGKLGAAVTMDAAHEALRLTTLNALAIVKAHAGSLANVRQVVQATVFVNATPDFMDHPKVADAATDILKALWGENGLPARAAVGAPSLPMDIPVELTLVVELAPEE